MSCSSPFNVFTILIAAVSPQSSGTEQALSAAQVTPSPWGLNQYGSKKNGVFSLGSAAMHSGYTSIIVRVLPVLHDCSPSYSCRLRTGRNPSPSILACLSYTQGLQNSALTSQSLTSLNIAKNSSDVYCRAPVYRHSRCSSVRWIEGTILLINDWKDGLKWLLYCCNGT